MAYKPPFQFKVRPDEYAASPVPSLSEWDSLWAAWDTVTRQMIPEEALLSKPIKLRNALIFYLGHIPTFLAIHLHRATGKGVDGLADYQKIFERGIDPDVENPELCHDHSEIPEEWPPKEEVLAFQGRVRDQIRDIYKSKEAIEDAAVRRGIWLAFEHEAMHLETLLYMLVQSEKTQPPNGTIKPDFKAMAAEARVKAVPNEWIDVPARKLTIGITDDAKDPKSKSYFGWDNEKPPRSTEVAAFVAKARPITNGEYASYLEDVGKTKIPASWTLTSITKDPDGALTNGSTNGETNGHSNGTAHRKPTDFFLKGKSVRTVFGPVSLTLALDWPVMASYDELLGCANWMGGRIPTLEEVRSIYAYADDVKAKQLENENGKMIPAVNG
jgi:hypothetical protein